MAASDLTTSFSLPSATSSFSSSLSSAFAFGSSAAAGSSAAVALALRIRKGHASAMIHPAPEMYCRGEVNEPRIDRTMSSNDKCLPGKKG